MRNIINSIFLFLSLNTFGQVGINTTTPNASSILDITSTTRGVLVPRMTQAQRNVIASPATSLLIYQTDNGPGFYYYNGSSWVSFANSGWSTAGNTGTTPATNKVGTTDNVGFVFATNNTEAIRVLNTGDVGIKTTTPARKLHLFNAAANTALRITDGTEGTNKILMSNALGQASWQTPATIKPIDYDWNWHSGNTNGDPVYHIGNVFIGTGATTGTQNLKVWNGATTGSKFETGSVEYFTDGTNTLNIGVDFAPINDGTQNVGSPTKRWTAVYSANGTIQTSDERLKEDIKPLNYGLKEVLKLRPVSFKWKEEKIDDFIIPSKDKKTKLGFIAQEVLKIIPEAICTKEWYLDGNDPQKGLQEIEARRYGISYSELITVTTKAIQEQQVMIEELKFKNQKLKVEIELLSKK